MLVPKLRFKEFKDEYNTYKLNDIVDFYKGNTLSKSDIKENGKFPCILYGELYTQYDEITDKVISYTDRSDKNLFHSKINDVLIPCSGETALDISTSTCILQDHVILGGDLNVLRPKFQNGKYLSYLLSNKKRIVIARYAQGDSIVHLYGEKIKNINIDLPTIEEQEKVSKLLEFLSKKIELQKQKIEALKIYKTGLFNKIYKEKLNDIKESKLREYAYLQGGYAFKSELFSKKGTPIIRIANINENIVDLKDVVFYDKEIPINFKFEINTGDILIAMSGATTGKIGIYKEKMKSYLNQRVGKIVLKRKDMIYSYLYFLFELSSYNMQLNTKLVAGAQPNISPTDIENLKFKIPSIKLQEHIANIVMNINKKLEIEGNKLQELNELKKGLLQKMFI
ncbi:restriction endonuclease subunit S [bacterium]|nr:restriction endonuclease subunit S [bacterium]